MTIIDWFFVGIGISGFLYTWRLMIMRIAWMYNHYPDADNLSGGIFFGFCCACVWPITLLCVGMERLDGRKFRYYFVEKVLPRPSNFDKDTSLEHYRR